ncbi:acyltransferase [Bacteroides fragilis]|uniref:acyltransferase n=1 Tax=Bacteroides fragilis TaxID=817 RepID=UPI00187A4EF7|nr:acyltransferase [Bacteroides fragilis]MBE7398400.1 acyltransferase [Bacteroides fragilis]
MELKKRENIGWIDLLRVLACFFVVFSHCCDAFIGQFDANRESFLTGTFLGSLMRPCVPIFVMMTGVLLFPVRTDMGTFYKKRIGRLIPPIIFWSLVLPVLYFVYLNYINPDTQNPLISMPDHSLEALWIKLYTFIFNFNFDTVPLWYLYMLIGLYLVMPIVSGWLKKASKKELKLFLSIWGVSLIAPYVKMFAPMLGYQGNYGNMGLWGICDWNDYGTFYYFSGFIGYLLLAYYLTRYPLKWSWKKLLGITIPMFLVGYLITSYGYVITQNHFPGNYAYLEIVWYFAGINVFMMTFPVFVIVQKIKVPSNRWLSHMASLTFGIYLSHYVFVFVAYDLLDKEQLPYIVRIISMACLVFLTCYAIVWLMSKSKLTDRFIR